MLSDDGKQICQVLIRCFLMAVSLLRKLAGLKDDKEVVNGH